MAELSESIKDTLGFIEHEWKVEETKHFACSFCGHPYADADGGAIRGVKTYPARCYESYNGRRCGGQILEVED